MRSMRSIETRMLGYTIERLDEYDDTGLLRSIRFEVLCPRSGAVLASHPSMRAARKYVIVQELGGALHAPALLRHQGRRVA